MKILMVSTLKRKIAPNITASRPRVIYDLSSGLINKGHKVTILGTGDSDVKGAKIIPVLEKQLPEKPLYEVKDADGGKHTIWPVTDSAVA